MSKRQTASLVLVVLFAAGCNNGGQTGGELGAKASGGRSSNTMGGGSDCVVKSSTRIAWTEATTLGIPAELFSIVEGNCQAPFVWNGTGWGSSVTVDPATGESVVTVSVDVDEASVRLVKEESASDAGGIVDCGASLEVDAMVTLDLPTGALVPVQKVTLRAVTAKGPSIYFVVQPADFGDWVSIATATSDTTLSMTFTMAPLQQACAGEVMLQTQTRSTDAGGAGVSMGSVGRFASWSESGCSSTQFSVSLEQPFQGTDLRAAVLSTFGDVQLSGEWQDGSTTRLGLQTSVAASQVCGDVQAIAIPVDVIANTDDGRVASLSGPGTVRATVRDGVLTQLALWSSTDLQCRSEVDTLAYRSADCLSVAEVTAQLGFNEYFAGTGTSGGRLELYVKDRNSAAAPAAADRVDRLSLTR